MSYSNKTLKNLINQANSSLNRSDFNNAEQLYLEALELSPDNAIICHYLGITYSQMNRHEAAINYLKKSIELSPGNPRFLLNLGEALLRKEEAKTALETFYKTIELFPDFPDVHFNLANALKITKNYPGAIKHYKQMIKLNPQHLNAYISLGILYFEHLHYKEAKEIFTKVLSLNRQLPQAIKYLEIIERAISRDNKLIDDFKNLDTFSDINQRFDDNELIYAYLTLIKKCLSDTLRVNTTGDEYGKIKEGLIWPLYAETMIGLKRLNNLHYCLSQVIRNKIPGDFIETGVWRGGATILMRAVLKAYDIKDRNVWVADSFEGLPVPNAELYPDDKNSTFHKMANLKVSLDEVKENFRKYGLLDEQVKFLKGWFKDTLPSAPIQQLAVIRLDGDMYESTIDGLHHLYPKLSPGGYIIIDDYGAVAGCRKAVEYYRELHNITDELLGIDYTGMYWQKS